MLWSALSFLSLLSFMSVFWRPMWAFSFQLYGGLAIFCGFVLFDTQLIVEKAEMGSQDVVGHALELFLDFVAIFVRLLVILMKNAEKREENERKEKNKRR